MQKIVINTCFGGFSLSDEAHKELRKVKDFEWLDDVKRDDPNLVAIVERLGVAANGRFAELKVVEIPDDVTSWYIHEYDGREHVAENHRTWG